MIKGITNRYYLPIPSNKIIGGNQQKVKTKLQLFAKNCQYLSFLNYKGQKNTRPFFKIKKARTLIYQPKGWYENNKKLFAKKGAKSFTYLKSFFDIYFSFSEQTSHTQRKI